MVQNSWYDDEKTIVLTRYSSSWSWDDYAEGLKEMYSMSDSVGYPVDTIVHSVDRQLPRGNPLVVARNTYRDPNEFDAISVYVNMPHVVETFVKLFETLSPAHKNRSFFAGSVEEAAEIIYAHRRAKASSSGGVKAI